MAHRESVCDRCHGNNPVWHVDSDRFNAAIEALELHRGAVICPGCFVEGHEKATGMITVWGLAPSTPFRHIEEQREARRQLMELDWKAAADEAAQIVHGAQAHQTEVTDKLAGHWAGRIVGAAIGKTPHEMRLVAIADAGVKPYCVCGWVGERMDDGEATRRFRDHVVTS